ncbi:hypothetical protein ACSAZL_04505 [Methanosarcina sp. T3]|uniref:hypothetical protein n=1 Tax=Methanosarcina sp. T3 TaxID=3439062 RepID=UPI003F831647
MANENEKKGFTGTQSGANKSSSEEIQNQQDRGFTGTQPRIDKVSSEKTRSNKK